MSQKSVVQKLLVKPNFRVLIVNEPEGYRATLGKMPENVSILNDPENRPVNLIQVFVTSEKELEQQLARLKTCLDNKGLLWVTYPKGSSKIKTDINRDIIRTHSETIGLKAVSLVSIDTTWAALRLKIS